MTSAPPLFQHAKLKVARADFHIQDLAAVARQYFTAEMHPLIVENAECAGMSRVKVRSEPMPPAFPLGIGDAIHNLRCALDFLMSELCAAKADDRLHFPFDQEERNLRNRIKDIQAKYGLPPDVAGIIADVIKPWEKGTYALWAMNKLDNHDKHKLLIPVASVTKLTGVSGYGPNNNSFTDCNFIVGAGGVVNFLGLPGPITITNPGTRVFDLSFRHDQFFPRRAVIPTLQKLHKLTLGVIDALEAHMQGGEATAVFAQAAA